jgi:hemoglobin
MESIYERIGGAPAVSATVDELYDRVMADPELSGYFARTDMRRQKAHLRAFVAEALGGPKRYRGRDMHAAHAGLGITPAAFDRVVAHLVGALASLGVGIPAIGAIRDQLAPLRDQIAAA